MIPHPPLANNWNRGAASRHTTYQSDKRGLHPVAHKLLLIAPTHGGQAELKVIHRQMVSWSPIQIQTSQCMAGSRTHNLLITSPTT